MAFMVASSFKQGQQYLVRRFADLHVKVLAAVDMASWQRSALSAGASRPFHA
jgi:hypothetical protein